MNRRTFTQLAAVFPDWMAFRSSNIVQGEATQPTTPQADVALFTHEDGPHLSGYINALRPSLRHYQALHEGPPTTDRPRLPHPLRDQPRRRRLQRRRKPDLACLGYTNTGVGAGGSVGVYIYLQQH